MFYGSYAMISGWETMFYGSLTMFYGSWTERVVRDGQGRTARGTAGLPTSNLKSDHMHCFAWHIKVSKSYGDAAIESQFVSAGDTLARKRVRSPFQENLEERHACPSKVQHHDCKQSAYV